MPSSIGIVSSAYYAAPPPGGINLVQAKAAPSLGVSLAYNSNVTAGDLLIVFIAWYITGLPHITGVTDSVGTSYSSLTEEDITVDANCACQIWYGIAGGSGANTVTASHGGTGDTTLYLHEFSGVDQTTPFVSSTNFSGGPSTTVAGAASGAMTVGNLIFSAFTHYGATLTITEDAADGFSLGCEEENGNYLNSGGTQYRVATATTSLTPNWTLSSSEHVAGTTAIFKAA